MLTQFVVLRHSGIPDEHFDLMIEAAPGSPLATWRAPSWPIDRPTELLRLPDHRREYLTYEGEVTGHRGRVDRVAAGQCEVEIAQGRWTVRWSDSMLAAMSICRGDADMWLASVG